MITYQIKDWDKNFENNKSREREKCSFVCISNKQDGISFARVMAEPDGAAIYGIWHMLVGLCSKQRKPRAGWLTLDGQQTGTPLSTGDFALLWRRPAKEVARAIEILVLVGWIERHGEEVPEECPCCDCLVSLNGIEEKRSTTPYSPPKAGDGQVSQQGQIPSSDEATPQKPNPIKLRLGTLFKRRPETPWSERECKAFKKLGSIEESDLREIERYYTLSIPKDKDYRRRDLLTLLNNWNGELDRARKYKPQTGF